MKNRQTNSRSRGGRIAAAALVALTVAALVLLLARRGRLVVEGEGPAPAANEVGVSEPGAAIAAEPPAEAFSARRAGGLEAPPLQLEQFRARRAKTALELQPFRESGSARITDGSGETGMAVLTNLNPAENAWYLLRLEWDKTGEVAYYHLENSEPAQRLLALDDEYPVGIQMTTAGGVEPCPFWGREASLAQARRSGATYAPLCDQKVFLRNPTVGHKTSKEWVTDFLRDHVWLGEKITVFVREKVYQDAYLSTSEVVVANSDTPGGSGRRRAAGAPARPRIDPRFESSLLMPSDLGIFLDNPGSDRVFVGRWYPARDNPGIYVSTIQPKLVAPEVLEEVKGVLNPLDSIEEAALVFMVAFDLEEFDLGFALGTEHPRVSWSERSLESVRPVSLPGPDGIGTTDPLVMTGMISPALEKRVAVTFTGGFKRSHGAFRYSDLALANEGSHYGFVEHGTVLSKLQPGLATAIVWEDNSVELRTWNGTDIEGLDRIRHARQNGLPIIEFDPATGVSRPGEFVRQWSVGNWSGSVDKRFRSLRAGLCQQETEAGKFLIYGYFSTATPSAMARVFHAYGCKYAMMLDMNALEHTYLAIYRQRGDRFLIQHLIQGMDVLDKSVDGQDLPRFVGFADNRDFFYLSRRLGS